MRLKFWQKLMDKEKAPKKSGAKSWLRELDLNQRPSGYEPDELPGCSIPRAENTQGGFHCKRFFSFRVQNRQIPYLWTLHQNLYRCPQGQSRQLEGCSGKRPS